MTQCRTDEIVDRPAGLGRWVVMLPLLVGILAGSLAVSMVNTALPTIAADLGLAGAARAWVVDAYPLALAASIVVAARLGDRFGRRTMLVAGMAGFGVINVLIAAASSPAVVIGGRALSGMVGALVIANVVSTIAEVYSGHERTVANGLWVATFGAATAVGPVVGGALTQAFGWESIFLMCAPIALAGSVLTLWLVPNTRAVTPPRWDLASVGLSAAGLAVTVYGISHAVAAPVAGLGLALLGVLLLGLFAAKQRRSADPLIDVGLFGRAGFALAFWQVLTAAAAMGAAIYLVSIHVQESGGTPIDAGLTLLPQALATIAGGIVAPLTVRLVSRRVAVASALALEAAGLLWVALGSASAPGLVLIGIGFGVVGSVAVSTLFDLTPEDRLSHAGALQEVGFAFGSAVGIAVFDAVARLGGAEGFTWAMASAGAVTGAVAAVSAVRGR
ncbi:MFS transporter [Gordonia aichiensis]|uniref:MFS transporter n=1 Tax=Gordonia aichiensis TaxID=36820 RepID=UPI0032665EDE